MSQTLVSVDFEETATLVSLDFEATGLRPDKSHIIQIGALCVIDGKSYEFEELCNPTVEVSDRICEITGLKHAEIRCARGVRDVLIRFMAFLRGLPTRNIVLIAYNGFRYDFPLLYSNCRKYGVQYEEFVTSCNIQSVGDPYLWVKRSLKTEHTIRNRYGRPSYKLGDVYECMFSRRFECAHTALADAKALLLIVTSPEHVLHPFETHAPLYIRPPLSIGCPVLVKSAARKQIDINIPRNPSSILQFLRDGVRPE